MARPVGRPRKLKPRRRSPGQGQVKADGQGGFRAVLPPESPARPRSRRFPTRAEAVAWLADVLAAPHRAEEPAPGDGVTLGALLSRWYAREAASSRWAPSTRRIYQRALRYWAPLYGTAIDALRPGDLQDVVAALLTAGNPTVPATSRRPLAPGPVVQSVELIRRALAGAVEDELIKRNPAARLSLPRVPHKAATALTRVEARTLAAAIRTHRHEAALTLLLTLGPRAGELLGLRWSDVDLEARELHIRQQQDTRTGEIRATKTGATPVIPLPDHAWAALLRHRERQHAGAVYVFEHEWHGRVRRLSYTGLRDAFRVLLKELGLPALSPHALRHTAGSQMIDAGVNPADVAAILGHRSAATTLGVYVHGSKEGARRAVSVTGALFDDLGNVPPAPPPDDSPN